jgi:hypothetical protein
MVNLSRGSAPAILFETALLKLHQGEIFLPWEFGMNFSAMGIS